MCRILRRDCKTAENFSRNGYFLIEIILLSCIINYENLKLSGEYYDYN